MSPQVVFFLLVEEVCFRAAEIDNFRTAVTLHGDHHAKQSSEAIPHTHTHTEREGGREREQRQSRSHTHTQTNLTAAMYTSRVIVHAAAFRVCIVHRTSFSRLVHSLQ